MARQIRSLLSKLTQDNFDVIEAKLLEEVANTKSVVALAQGVVELSILLSNYCEMYKTASPC